VVSRFFALLAVTLGAVAFNAVPSVSFGNVAGVGAAYAQAAPVAPDPDAGLDDTAVGGLDESDLGTPVDETDQGAPVATPPAVTPPAVTPPAATPPAVTAPPAVTPQTGAAAPVPTRTAPGAPAGSNGKAESKKKHSKKRKSSCKRSRSGERKRSGKRHSSCKHKRPNKHKHNRRR
jgi:hypothetical protein